MKKATAVAIVALVVFGFSGNLFAYEGGTKMVAAMNQPERGEPQFSPLLLVPHESLTPSKLIVRFLHRIPEPTLGRERIREEVPGRSLGTKGLVRFQKERGRF